MVILHGSDLQIGRPYRPAPARAFLALARALEPDVVVVSGDLTQRAKAREYRLARDFVDALAPLPVVVTPGNHDVPLYRVWERLFAPHRNWRRFLGPELDTVTSVPGATVVALDSSAPRRAIVAGRLGAGQVDFARRAFAAAPEGDVKVVVTHHHFISTPDGLGGRPLPGAAALLAALEEMGVDLVLGGHVHRTHLADSRALVPGSGPGIPLVACGTTASRRGRGPESGLNSLNVVRVGGEAVEVETRLYDAGADAFVAAGARTFQRPGTVPGSSGAPA
ncbi:MAG: transcriptional regulator [Gemmatimonadota bacterium]